MDPAATLHFHHPCFSECLYFVHWCGHVYVRSLTHLGVGLLFVLTSLFVFDEETI